MSKIISYKIIPQSAPLKKPFKTAQHTVNEAVGITVKLTLDSGEVGLGSGTPNAVVTGDTESSLISSLKQILPQIIGRDLSDWNSLLDTVRTSIDHSMPAKAAVELALYDLRAQRFGVSLPVLLGGSNRSVETDMTIGIDSLDAMVSSAKNAIASGYHTIKIKVGGDTLEEDVKRVLAIASTLGPSGRLRLDANQGWSRSEAQIALETLAELHLPIDFVEQPVQADDIKGLASLTAMQLLPIMADESVFSYRDAMQLLNEHAVDVINIKLMKTGGLSTAVKIADAASDFGVPCMIGCMIEPTISIRAAIAFAASHPNIHYVDLDALDMIAGTTPGVEINDSVLTLPEVFERD